MDRNKEDKCSSTIYKSWDDGYVVRSMTKEDAKLAQTWFLTLCPTSFDLEIALESSTEENKKGFCMGEYRGVPVASAIRVYVAEGVFYGSYYFVKEEYRGKGFGERIRDEVAIKVVGDNLLVIDAHDNLIEMNKRRGYKEAYQVHRVMGRVPSNWDTSIIVKTVEISGADINKVIDFDNNCFVKANSTYRRALLEGFLNIEGGLCVAAVDGSGEIIGYGYRRPSFNPDYHLIGPLYAETYDVAYNIVRRLCQAITGGYITLDICVPNGEACRLVKVLGLEVDFIMVRMYMNKDLPPLSEKIFGLTSVDVCGF